MTFNQLIEFKRENKEFGMIVLGAGGAIQKWIYRIEEILKEQGVVEKDKPTFSGAKLIEGNIAGKDGRRDLLLIFNAAAKVKLGKLAMWRLAIYNQIQISWVEDFIPNYGKDYGAAQVEVAAEDED